MEEVKKKKKNRVSPKKGEEKNNDREKGWWDSDSNTIWNRSMAILWVRNTPPLQIPIPSSGIYSLSSEGPSHQICTIFAVD